MIRDELEQQLSQPEFLAEVHHLLWIKPFVNRGQAELVWSCRDHAMTLGLVASLLGNRALLITGQATFIQGPMNGRSSLGLEQKPHGWFRTETGGTFDASWRLESVRNMPQWRPWDALGVFAGKVQPAGAVTFASTTDHDKYKHNVNFAIHQGDGRFAVYLSERAAVLTMDLAKDQYTWINSPLTDRLRKVGPHLYFAAALHLLHFLEEGPSLRELAQDAAWEKLANRYPNALEQTVEQWRVND